MIKIINTTTAAERTLFEGGSGGGGEGGSGSDNGSGNDDQGKGKEDPNAERAKTVEDSSTKGDKPQEPQPHDEWGSWKDKGAEVSGRDKGKGKQVLQSSDEDYYYQGEQDDFDALNIQEEEQEEVEELPCVNEYEEEASFDDWEEG